MSDLVRHLVDRFSRVVAQAISLWPGLFFLFSDFVNSSAENYLTASMSEVLMV